MAYHGMLCRQVQQEQQNTSSQFAGSNTHSRLSQAFLAFACQRCAFFVYLFVGAPNSYSRRSAGTGPFGVRFSQVSFPPRSLHSIRHIFCASLTKTIFLLP